MALLEILRYPDTRLHTVAKPIVTVDAALRGIVKDMYETMYHNQGVGLAATQVNIHQRVFVMDVSDTRDQPFCIINPEILSKSGEQYEIEGCLSVGGGVYDKVKRALKLRLRAMNLEGKIFEMEAENLMAACIQHETDHLNGILFMNRLSRLKQERMRKKIEKSEERE